MNGEFPKEFLWGSATAAHQVEGNNLNCDTWAEEHAKGSPYAERSGDGVDHYRLYREDIALMAKLGMKAYRFSIEWARIEPEAGHYSRSAVEHYRDVLNACHEHGLTPVVTLHHFTSPRWLMRFGGWADPATADRFAAYCGYVASELGERIPYAFTMNEVDLPVMLRELFVQMGQTPPVGIEAQSWQAPEWREEAARLCGTTVDRYFPFLSAADEASIAIVKDAHTKARAAIKRVRPGIQVGLTLALPDVQALPGGEARAERVWRDYFRQYLDVISGDDVLGVQNYTREVYGPEGVVPPEPGAELTQMGYVYDPEALARVLRRVAGEVSVPLLVTEHGVATDDDARRVEFIRRGLQGLRDCLADGVDVRGYLYWSTFDNFEWNFGYAKRFGLIGVDRSTQRRYVKDSARYLGEIAQRNGLGG